MHGFRCLPRVRSIRCFFFMPCHTALLRFPKTLLRFPKTLLAYLSLSVYSYTTFPSIDLIPLYMYDLIDTLSRRFRIAPSTTYLYQNY